MTPGQAAYTLYASKVMVVAEGNAELFSEVATYLADAYPPWNKLPSTAQEGWEEIAEAAIQCYEDPENLGPIARDMDPEELARFRKQQHRG